MISEEKQEQQNKTKKGIVRKERCVLAPESS